jgi:hypothetical protein
MEVTTGSGTVICATVVIPRFSCLGASVRKFTVICHDLPSRSPVEGLLGLDFLKAAKVILDFDQNIIKIKD